MSWNMTVMIKMNRYGLKGVSLTDSVILLFPTRLVLALFDFETGSSIQSRHIIAHLSRNVKSAKSFNKSLLVDFVKGFFPNQKDHDDVFAVPFIQALDAPSDVESLSSGAFSGETVLSLLDVLVNTVRQASPYKSSENLV